MSENEIDEVDFEDYRDELCARVDFFGWESLTEDEQIIVDPSLKVE